MDSKDLIIEKQAAEIKTLKEAIETLREEIARLKKDSSNSSKPPSSDIVKPPKLGHYSGGILDSIQGHRRAEGSTFCKGEGVSP